MDFLKSQSARLQQQFGQLTPSQKMLTMALGVIMLMTLVWWGKYAGTADMEPLMAQELNQEDFQRIEDNLRAHDIPFTPVGTRIMVPADRRIQAISQLAQDQVLPKDMSNAFSDIVGKMDNPLNSQERSAAIRNEAKQLTLAQILRGFPKVKNAMVVLDTNKVRSFTNPVNATATVTLMLKSGEKADGKLVSAAADVVTGAVAGLQRSNVKVIVDGVSRFFAPEDGSDGGGSGGGSRIDTIREFEGYYADVVQKHLSFCENVMVHVTVASKDEAVQTESDLFDPKGTVSKEKERTEELGSTSTAANRPDDVGVTANTGSNKGMTVGGGGGDDAQTSRTEKNTSSMENKFGHVVKKSHTAAGTVSVVSASVTFPRSFFIKAYKALKGVDKEPSEVVLAPFIQSELDRWRKVVRACLNLPADDALLAVDTYVDFMPTTSDMPAPSNNTVAMLVGSHGKEIVLGVMALASLFMVSSLVRKSSPIVPGTKGISASDHTMAIGSTVDAALARNGVKLKASVSEDAAEVGEGGQALDGIELDDDTVRAQQVIQQVSTLVKEDPEMAAAIIKRWVSRT